MLEAMGVGTNVARMRARGGVRSRKKPGFLRRNASLAALVAPGAAFGAGILTLSTDPRFAWLKSPWTWRWEIFAIAAFGGSATFAGWLDHRFHTALGAKVGPKERNVELAALVVGGLPLFGLMAWATWSHSLALLLPVLAQTALIAALVLYDELKFHTRRCGRYETMLHRVLVFGQAGALLAWMHLCFVRPL